MCVVVRGDTSASLACAASVFERWRSGGWCPASPRAVGKGPSMSAITDPIADLLTRIRNAQRAGHEQVEIPQSRLKLEIVKILAAEKYVRGYQVIADEKQGILRVYLKYGDRR